MDEHPKGQYARVDQLAERIQTLGTITVGDPRHVAELTTIERAPDGAEGQSRTSSTPTRRSSSPRDLADKAGDAQDSTTEDLLSSEVTPVDELQIWFVAEHLVDVPLID